jgi:hypothetical protein
MKGRMKAGILAVFVIGLVFAGVFARAALPNAPIEESEFIFARVQFNMTLMSMAEREAPWHHDHPFSEDFTLSMLRNVSNLNTTRDSYRIVHLDDPEIHRYPFLYFSEPGYMEMKPEEADNLRAWFNRGGFAVFDDFRGTDLDTLRDEMKKVFPARQLYKLELSHPVFRAFYEIESLQMVPPYSDLRFEGGPPEFWGMDDDGGRLILVANQNNDLGEFFEWVDKGEMDLKTAAKAAKLMVNYLLYGMTH